ncbi:hypothetical protein PQX77_015685 [Marasmius sp. AFHP31]|nr:hypothetical protein PQX77_015685 [Marasmius sp. AFHP31]
MPPRPTAGTINMDADGIGPLDDGDWVSHPGHRIVDHIHRNNRKCNDLLGHIIMAKRRGDPRLKAALKDIEDDIVQPYKESAQRAKAKVSSLEAKLDSVKAECETRLTNMDNNFNSKYNALQQRYQDALDDKAKLIVENTSLRESMDRTRRDYSPSSFRGHGHGISHRRDGRITPYAHISSGGDYSTSNTSFTHLHERIPFDSRLINWGSFNMLFPNRETAFTTIQHSGFRPCMNQTLVAVDWNKVDGLGHTLSYVDQCITTNTIPTPTVFPDAIRVGLQSIPLTSEDIKALAEKASTTGDLLGLYYLRFALSFAQYLEQTRDDTPHVNPFYGSKKDILSMVREANPTWSQSSKFLDTSKFRITSIPATRNEEALIPPVGLPTDDLERYNYVKWGQYWFVHRDPSVLIGQTMTDSGYFDAESIRAGHILAEIAPQQFSKDQEALDAFRLAFISLVSKAGLYKELVCKYNLTVANTICLTHVREAPLYPYHYVASVLASYGITISVANSMV